MLKGPFVWFFEFLIISPISGFNGAASTGDTGNISFGGEGATAVSFHAADLANGTSTIFASFDASGNPLQFLQTQVDSLSGSDHNEILNFTSIGGRNIFRIESKPTFQVQLITHLTRHRSIPFQRLLL